MVKRQIATRLTDDSLLERLDSYIKDKKTFKTDIVGGLAQYLDSPNMLLGERMTALENRLTQVEIKLKGTRTEN